MKSAYARPRGRTILFYSSLISGAVCLVWALQSVALWLPFKWTYGFASNATVWPVVQLGLVIIAGLCAWALWRLKKRSIGVVYGLLALICLLPTVYMMVELRQFASQHGVQPSLLSLFHSTRFTSPPDQPHVRYGRAEQTDLYLSGYFPRYHDDLPTVLYVHGGGWSGGSRTENSGFFRWLNDQGYNVVSIDYRTARDHDASWYKASRDVACALAWLNQQAANYHVDTRRITVMGDSAGGQLALRAAYGVARGDVTSSCGGQPLVPESVVGIVPAIDMRELYDDPVLGNASRVNVVRYLGGTPTTATTAYDESTILTHVQAGLPRTLIINARNDTLVSARSGVALVTQLNKVGVMAEQYTLPYAAHSYWINPGGEQNRTAQELIVRFLRQ